MKIGYFINQYPKPSHSFIRREILGLEARGNIVRRYALTSTPSELVDPSDLSEQRKTEQVFQQSPSFIATSVVRVILARPRAAIRAFATAVRMGWRSDRGVMRHLAYFVEAAVVGNWCRRDEIQHLHAHFGTNSAAVALLVHKITGIPYSFTAHGPDDFDRAKFLSLNEKIRSASFVVGVSSFGRSQLMRWAEPEYWSKIEVVHCGLNSEFYAGAQKPVSSSGANICSGKHDDGVNETGGWSTTLAHDPRLLCSAWIKEKCGAAGTIGRDRQKMTAKTLWDALSTQTNQV